MSGIKGATVLIGGGSEALDAIDGATLSDGDAARVTMASGVYHYHLNASSGATENSPYVIAPNTNPGTKRWVLVTPQGAFSHVSARQTPGTSVASGPGEVVIYSVEDYDLLTEYDHTTGIFTPLYDGYYSVSASARFATDSWLSNKYSFLQIAVEGSVIRTGERVATWDAVSLPVHVTVTGTVYMAAAEELTILVVQNNGSALSLDTSIIYNGLSIDRLSD